MFWFTGLTMNNGVRLTVLLGVLLSAMLLPSFSIHPSLPNIRIDEMLLFGVYGINILSFILHRFRLGPVAAEQWNRAKPAINAIHIIFLLLTASVIISNIYGVLVLKGLFTVRDAMEFVTLFKYFLVITLAASLDLQREEFSILKWVFLGTFTFLILFAWGQHYNVANLNTWLSPFFNPNHWEHLIVGNPARVLGTFDNPNVFGNFAVICLTVFVAWYYFANSGRNLSIPLLILIGLTLKLIMLTISRTALLSTAVVLSYLSIWAVLRFHWQKKTLLKLGALFILTIVLTATASEAFFYRVNEGLEFRTSTSAQGHFRQWAEAGDSIQGSPILGWGTQKATMTTIVDNEYALYTRRYGIVGLIFYMWFFLKPFTLALKRVNTKNQMVYGEFADPPTLFSIAFSAALLGIFIYNFFAGIFYNLQLMTLFGILMGFVYGTEKRRGY